MTEIGRRFGRVAAHEQLERCTCQQLRCEVGEDQEFIFIHVKFETSTRHPVYIQPILS